MAIPQDWSDELLDQKRQRTDALADEAMAQLVAQKGREEAQRIFNLLIREIELPISQLPAELRPFFAATNRLPAWVDPDKVAKAQALFRDHGPKFLVFLYYKSLPILYLCKNGAEVLLQTGRLAHLQDEAMKVFTRRIAETGQFIVDVMSEGNLAEGKQGIQSIQKVRLIHAAIRHFIPAEQWDAELLGQPINQEDMAITLMTFSIAILDALAGFGIQEPEDTLEAYLHTWTGIGFLLGIDPDLLPATLAQARHLQEKILRRQEGASEAGQLLTQALLQFAHDTLPRRLDATPELLIQHLIGRERAQLLGVAPPFGCLSIALPDAIATLLKLGEKLEDKIAGEPLGQFIDHLSRKTVLAMVNFFNVYKGSHFSLSAQLKEAWLGI
ncbi:MAG: oxygenase MpaB family protein [Saprospiraceae bacterium]